MADVGDGGRGRGSERREGSERRSTQGERAAARGGRERDGGVDQRGTDVEQWWRRGRREHVGNCMRVSVGVRVSLGAVNRATLLALR